MAQARENRQPNENAVEVRIENVPKSPTRLRVRFLGDIHGLHVHYVRGRGQVPCLEDCCPRPVHQNPLQYRGYAPAEWLDQKRWAWVPCVFEITERLYWHLEGRILRGEEWVVYRRPGRRDNEECYGELLDVHDPQRLRVDIDAVAVVRRRYYAVDLQWGKGPILGQPLLLTPSVCEQSRPPRPTEEAPVSLTRDQLLSMAAEHDAAGRPNFAARLRADAAKMGGNP